MKRTRMDAETQPFAPHAKRGGLRGGRPFPPAREFVVAAHWPALVCGTTAGLCAALLYFHTGVVVWAIFLALGACGIACVAGRRSAHRQLQVPMAIGAVPAIIIGTVLGTFCFQRFTYYAYWYDHARVYRNALPDQLVAGLSDAGGVLLTDAVVNKEMAVSYALDGSRYCIAPILVAGVAPEEVGQVSMWAAGIDCCDHAGRDFECSSGPMDSTSAAHSGVVIFEHEALFYTRSTTGFSKARVKAEALHGLAPTEDALFVELVTDEEFRKTSSKYRLRAVAGIVLGSVVYAALASILLVYVPWYWRCLNLRRKYDG